MYKKYTGSLTDLSREAQKLIKKGSTTFYQRETVDGYHYDVKYRNGYGIEFAKMNYHRNGNVWQAYLTEKTNDGWRPCYNAPLDQCNYENLSDEDILKLCQQVRDIEG